MLTTPVFQIQPALDANFKITAVDYCDGKLYVGDENGGIHKFTAKFDGPNIIPSIKDAPTAKITKGKITAIKHLQLINQILVQTEKQLYLFDGETLLKDQDIISPNQKDCEMFVLDEDPRSVERAMARLLVLKSDKRIAFYDHDGKHNRGQFILRSENTNLGSKPTAIGWYGKNVFIGFDKKSYQVMDFETRRLKEIESLKDFSLPQHRVKIISDEETLLLGPSDLFIPISTSLCDKLDQSPIQAMQKLAGISVLDPYIIMLGENKIQVFNKVALRNRPRMLQEINVDTSGSNVGRSISVTSNKVFFATTTRLYYLAAIPYRDQINKCLDNGRVEDAFMIFDQYVSELDPDRQRKIDSLKVDAAWIHFRDLKFKETEAIIQDLNFDVKEFLALFLSYIPANKTLFESKNISTVSNFFEESRKRPNADNELKKDSNKAMRAAKEFLARILENRRKYLLDNYKNLKDIPEFIASENFSPFSNEIRQGKVSRLTVEAHLEIIDCALLKLLLDLLKEAQKEGAKESQREEQLASLLGKKLFCGGYYKELEAFFCEDQKPSDSIQAKFYEQFGRYKDALEVWSRVLNYPDPVKVARACEEMIRILTNYTFYFKEAKEKNLIFEYLAKILLKNSNYARTFFLQIDDKVLPPTTIENFLISKYGKKSLIRETFYEVLTNEKKIEDEKFHTALALLYVENIFERRQKDQPVIEYKTQIQKDAELQSYLKKFHNFLRDPAARYKPENILYEIKDSWLLEDEIYLYGITKGHNEALNKLLDLGKFDKAEKYCADKQERLLTKLFELYIKKYNEYNSLLRQKPSDSAKLEADRDAISKVIHIFLKKYAAHPQLDPAAVIDRIPDEWDLWENKEDSGVYSFLFYSLSATLHQKRNAKVAKYLSELDSLDTQYKLLKAQSAHVTIRSNRRCESPACGKPIGRTVFVVYPNGVIAHHTCSQDKLTVCPVTKQNFEKTFSG